MDHVLLVEDSELCQKIVARTLGHCKVTWATNVDDALVILRNHQVDLILLDINLPRRNGFSLLTELQAESSAASIPVICLTGKTDVSDKVAAFSLGADDYLCKPFDPLELRARVDGRLSKLKRLEDRSHVLEVDGIEVDLQRHRVTVDSDEDGGKSDVTLTQTEFKLLGCLIRSPERVFSRDQLLVAAWGEDADVLDRVVDVHLCGLRKKLGGRGSAIQSIQGVGYRFSSGSREHQKRTQRKKAA